MADINIFKGHNIQISGKPNDDLNNIDSPKSVAIKPYQFKGIKPKLLVKEGDSVKIGTPLFKCKTNEQIIFPSPGCGKIKEIKYGERRRIEKIEIEISDEEVYEKNKSFKFEEISALSLEEIMPLLINGCLTPFIRQRPFNKIADPKNLPRDIFVSGWNTAPLSVNLDLALRGRRSQFQAGVTILDKITKGNVHLSYDENSVSESLIGLENAVSHTMRGPHPAGNVGIQIHHIAPLGPNDHVWVVNAQDVARIGNFFLTGELDMSLVITVGGPSVLTPSHIKSRIGVNVSPYLSDNIKDGDQRIISGDVLTGKKIESDDFLGFYDSSLTVIPEGGSREFIGMLKPGNASSRYSLTNAFLGTLKGGYDFNTLKNGSERYMVPINSWEEVLPMDILPNPLYRAILVEDIEEMEQLGIYECDEEDFALCSFACPSKIDLGKTINDGLNLIESES